MADSVKTVKQYHHSTHKGTEFESGIIQVVFPKWESKFFFGVYRYHVDAFVADELLLLAGNISTYPIYIIYYRYLYSFPMVHIPSKIVEAFTNNSPYTEREIYMRSQVCKR